eukprot:scaffold26833_cov168-Amphora_coffeaeformis.AAC.2
MEHVDVCVFPSSQNGSSGSTIGTSDLRRPERVLGKRTQYKLESIVTAIVPVAMKSGLVPASLFLHSFFLVDSQARLSDPVLIKETNRELIVNGINTNLGQYPWHVRVGCCSGALIAPDVVLTAGHVLPPPDAVSAMKLYVGAYETDTNGLEDGAQGFDIQQAWLHPNYTTIHNDFALFLLNATSSEVEPVKITPDNSIPEVGSDVTMLGTGTFNLTTSQRSKVLQSAVTQTISNEDCRLAHDPNRSSISYGGDFIGPTNLCTFSDQDGCVFDSGGPIVYKDHDEGDILVGLISFGVDCADVVFPAVNARVSAVYDWIADTVCQHSRDPPADFNCSGRVVPANESEEITQSVTTELRSLHAHEKLLRPQGVMVVSALISLAMVGLLAMKKIQQRSTDDGGTGERQRLLPAREVS